ncbi:hypothetical protein CH275_18660 [Rhodococcus sp. 06-235-1A]|uniref:glycoside hydrolase family 16 protein n=1 Tax=Rhodococcus sp. 06-235-1A TaxID=2022508 RepID=UPI000B9A5D2A|nr:glycoside hydrolase family 16 protein [Rhodococcus sp. 06-235-1A]OZD01818.1 hypothetical protein CH275_18660 [Rhodococcus sp. 06-235-1A]
MPGAYVQATPPRRRWPVAGAVFVVVASVTVGFVVYAQSKVIDSPRIAPIGANATTVYDTFVGPAGQRVDPALWTTRPDDSAVVDNGVQRYSTSQDNASVDGAGHLSITAQRVADGVTSAELTSTSAFTFGRVEARIELPVGGGLYPAFRLISTDLTTTGEPVGTIDAVEPTGDGDYRSGISTTPDGGSSTSIMPLPSSDGYHVYWIERGPGVVTTGIDSTVVHRATADDLGGSSANWVFDQPFRVQIDLRVGTTPSDPTESIALPAAMSIDWVRTRSD